MYNYPFMCTMKKFAFVVFLDLSFAVAIVYSDHSVVITFSLSYSNASDAKTSMFTAALCL